MLWKPPSDVEKRRAEIIHRLNTHGPHVARFPKGPYVDEFFAALADAGDFNREHPERAIPKMSEDTHLVFEPSFGVGY